MHFYSLSNRKKRKGAGSRKRTAVCVLRAETLLPFPLSPSHLLERHAIFAESEKRSGKAPDQGQTVQEVERGPVPVLRPPGVVREVEIAGPVEPIGAGQDPLLAALVPRPSDAVEDGFRQERLCDHRGLVFGHVGRKLRVKSVRDSFKGLSREGRGRGRGRKRERERGSEKRRGKGEKKREEVEVEEGENEKEKTIELSVITHRHQLPLFSAVLPNRCCSGSEDAPPGRIDSPEGLDHEPLLLVGVDPFIHLQGFRRLCFISAFSESLHRELEPQQPSISISISSCKTGARVYTKPVISSWRTS